MSYIIDAIRTPIGRYAGGLASVRADDLAALPIESLIERNEGVDWAQIDEVILGCANQAGEDNRNVARMASLLAGLPYSVPATTVNRLCGSGLDALGIAARMLKLNDANMIIAGGVESMSRAPFVMGKTETGFARTAKLEDTTMGWRFVNPKLKAMYGVETMPETAENVAEKYQVSREDQDLFALRSQQKAANAQKEGKFAEEIVAVSIPQRKGDPVVVSEDEHIRPSTTIEGLAKLKAPFREGGSVTAGNASGINDGACALLLASEEAVKANNFLPKAKIINSVTVGVEPKYMGIGPAPAIEKLLARTGVSIDDIDLFEINEAFAAQALASTRSLGLEDDDPRVNPQGGAIALGHPLGMSGARLVTTAVNQLIRDNKRYAVCAMCIGVGQGIAMLIENAVSEA